MKPIYVTFEQAKWLKEKEFDELCLYPYDKDGLVIEQSMQKIWQNFNIKYFDSSLVNWICCSAPEQWQVVEWLRVVHDIFIEICYWKSDKEYQWKVNDVFGKQFNSPQAAYSAAFDYIKNNM